MGDFPDQDSAFEWINKQDWTPKKKADARYRWRKRFAPDTIRRRLRECNICYHEQPQREFVRMEGRCCHCSIICQSCCDRLDMCPYCREVWKEKEPVVPIVLVIPISELLIIEQLLSQMNIFIARIVPATTTTTAVSVEN